MDFSKMKYRVDAIPMEIPIASVYPDLKRHPILSSELELNGLDNELVVRYLLCLFTKDSPFVEEYPDLLKRKGAILRFLNVVPDAQNKLPQEIVDMTAYKISGVLMRAILILRISKSVDWSIARAAEEKQAQLLERMLVPTDDVNAEYKLQQTVELNRRQLEESISRILSQENSVRLQEGVMQFMADESLGIKPEEYMDYFANNNTVFPDVIP